jgi:hypothetical protein
MTDVDFSRHLPMRARGIGLGFGHHLMARHHICPGLVLGRAAAGSGMAIGRETPRRQHSKRIPASPAVPVQAAQVVSCAGGHPVVPYQYCGSSVRSAREAPAAAVAGPEGGAEGRHTDGFAYAPPLDDDRLANPYKDCY